MLSKFLRSRSRPPAGPIATVPQGVRIYAVGDIHGRLDLLQALLAKIEADDLARGPAETHLLFLGDLIDRGPQSAQVVERLQLLASDRPAGRTRFLLGNHEEVFLMALQGDEKALRFFTRIGGRETILSYGIDEAEYSQLDYAELLRTLIARVPQSHAAFLSDFEDLILFGDYAFVHAGIRPHEPLDRQRPKDLRWIREEFLDFQGPLEKVIVHGHTISQEVDVLPHRIGLDTGAYASDKLTAMGFEGDGRWTLQTCADDARRGSPLA